jgi:hypothetical protein
VVLQPRKAIAYDKCAYKAVSKCAYKAVKQENKQDAHVIEIKQCGIIHESEYLPG